MSRFTENLKAIVGTVGKDQSHDHRFINLDGTPYGSSGLARVMLRPSIQLNFSIAVITGAVLGSILKLPIIEAASVWTVYQLQNIFGFDIAAGALRKAVPIRDNWIIDRQAEHHDPQAAAEAMRSCQIDSSISLGAGIVTGLFVQPLVSYGLWRSVLYSGRQRKIASGQWTVLKEPPPKIIRQPKIAKNVNRVGQRQPAFG